MEQLLLGLCLAADQLKQNRQGFSELLQAFPPAPKQLFSSEDFLQCEMGSAAAWETGMGEGAVLLSLPFLPPHERGAEALSS